MNATPPGSPDVTRGHSFVTGKSRSSHSQCREASLQTSQKRQPFNRVHCVDTCSQLLEQHYGACGSCRQHLSRLHGCLASRRETNRHIHGTVVTQHNTASVRSRRTHCPRHFAMVSECRRLALRTFKLLDWHAVQAASSGVSNPTSRSSRTCT